jgi:hypothetical protein
MKHRIVKGNFYGISKVKYVWHGCWSDPEVIYKGYSFTYWDVENALWYEFKEYKHLGDYDGNAYDEEFAQWIFDNQDNVHAMLDDWIYCKCYNKKVS